MKPMTIEQGAIYARYKINHDELNRKLLHDWEVRYLAWKILRDSGKHRS